MSANDVAAVVNVVNLYAMALDSHRYSLFTQVFTEDVRCDFGGGVEFNGREALATAFQAIHAGFSATQHMVCGHVVTVDGDTAHCASYVHARFKRGLASGEGVFDSSGWYDDVLVRTADSWRIKDRTSRMVTALGELEVMAAMPGVKPEFALLSLAAEADAGRVKFFKAAGG